MGATDFTTQAEGATVEEAFASAVDQARWDHGHSGYTGTIAEKHSFVEFVPKHLDETEGLMDLIRSVELAYDCESYDDYTSVIDGYSIWSPKTRSVQVGVEKRVTPRTDGSVHEWEQPVYEEQLLDYQTDRKQKLMTLRHQFPDERNLKRLLEIAHGDKWGPCVAVKLGPTTWAFTGIASC